ncbi:MAG: prolyl-tRNA synthetase associated domain-containing protein [Clostridia bacterium]|nr:prolyl-tRNA synthetase associated domain-containing protein [Clostridia bacterium]
MKLYEGRPENLSEREERERRVYDALDKLGIKYGRVDHAAAWTMEDCIEIDRALGVAMCKNLFLCNRQKTDFYLLLMPSDKPFRTKELSSQLGVARLSFAAEADMERYLGLLPGAVSVLGLMNDSGRDVRLLIDEDLRECEYIGAHPCVNTSSLKIKTEDILRVFLGATGHEPTFVTLTGADNIG